MATKPVSRAIASKARKILSFAEEFAKTAKHQFELEDALYRMDGMVIKEYSTYEERREFHKTKEYRRILKLIESLPRPPVSDLFIEVNLTTGRVTKRTGAKSA